MTATGRRRARDLLRQLRRPTLREWYKVWYSKPIQPILLLKSESCLRSQFYSCIGLTYHYCTTLFETLHAKRETRRSPLPT